MKMKTKIYVKFQDFLKQNGLVLTNAKVIFDENCNTTIDGGYLVEEFSDMKNIFDNENEKNSHKNYLIHFNESSSVKFLIDEFGDGDIFVRKKEEGDVEYITEN